MNSVKVGNVEYSVEFMDREAGLGRSDNIIGSHNRTDGRIRVAYIKNRRSLGQTILHEIVHAVVEGYKVKPLRSDSGTHDEDAVDQLATGLDEAMTSIGIYIEDLFEGSHGE